MRIFTGPNALHMSHQIMYGTKEKRKSCQDDSPQTCTERARSPREVEHELSIYPWMEIHRSNQGKKMKSKRNLDCIPLLVLDIE